MDSLTQIALTRALVDIDSTTGREAEAGEWIARTLEQFEFHVERHKVADGRFNVYGTCRGRETGTPVPPVVVLSTHFDCVPPFLPSRVVGARLYGRGTCDAKGTLVAMIAAAARLREAGDDAVGLLFVVAEERGSEGAREANAHAPASVRFLIDGEPTDNRLGTSTRGVYRVRLLARGRAAHSSLPHLGDSAIDKLVDALVALRYVKWPRDPDMGRTFYTVGLIAGGVAPNVIAADASAELMFRTVGDAEVVRELIDAHVGALVTVEDVMIVPPVRLRTVPDVETAAFPFTTDIPLLDRWGEPLLLGPGSVTVAHTDEEHVEIAELERAVELYVQITRALLEISTSRSG